MLKGIKTLRRSLAASIVVGAAALLPATAVAVDLDADGEEDLNVFRGNLGEHFFVSSEFNTSLRFQWGLPGDVPVNGKYSNQHNEDVAVWRPSTGTWFIRYDEDDNFNYQDAVQTQWGLQNDIPQPCRRDNDNFNDLVIWRPSNGVWYSRLSDGNGADENGAYGEDDVEVQQWGLSTDTPIAADYDNDNLCDYAIFREGSLNDTQAYWFIITSGTANTSVSLPFGLTGDVPVPGDYDGDGQIDIAVYRPSTGLWIIRNSNVSQGDLVNRISVFQWGLSTDIPVPMDFDGDGTTDLAVFRPLDPGTGAGQGNWYIRTSPNSFGQSQINQFGLNGDRPLGERRGGDDSDF